LVLKLNIGAGDTHIDGYTPVDIKTGTDAAQLPYADNSVDEIYACHVLEHFPVEETVNVLTEWRRVLKPGGRIKVAVPDFDKLIEKRNDPLQRRIASRMIVGGWTDTTDKHGAVFDGDSLRDDLYAAGFGSIDTFESFANDNSAADISLNLTGVKRWWHKKDGYKVTLVLSQPRIAFTDPLETLIRTGYELGAMRPNWTFTVVKSKGAFWERDIECGIEDAITQHDPDIILFADFDGVYTPADVFKILDTLVETPTAAAVGPVQMSRHDNKPLVMEPHLDYSTPTTRVRFAHFGLTAVRADAFKELAKPWFLSIPGKKDDGEYSWRHWNRSDGDITFWRQMIGCGFEVYQHNQVVIGHIIEAVKWPAAHGDGVLIQPLDNYLKHGKPGQAVFKPQVYAMADADKRHGQDYWSLSKYQPGFEWLKTKADGWQYGEQGILQAIAERVMVLGDRCVEVGAGDGSTLPLQSARLICNLNMPAVLIESDHDKCERLKKIVPARCRVIENNAEAWNIGDMIGNAGVGLLCLDTDGGEFDMLCAVECYPKVICVEHRDLIENMEPPNTKQATVGNFAEWAEDNDYTVVVTTRCNTIMVRNDLIEKVRE
jgi:SAM-dependent methyltransferase